MAENDAFAFLKGDNHGDFITRDLWIQADTDANGVLDYEEFKVLTSISCGILISYSFSFYLALALS